MARRHWLDPLARRLLIATGQLPSPPTGPSPPPGPPSADDPEESLELELLALRLTQDPALRLRDADEVRRAARLGWSLDVNRATASDWRRLPGCSAEQADLLLRLQAGGVQLSGPEDLQRLLGLDDARLHAWLPLLRFHWYGEPTTPGPAPVAVNRATGAELQARLGLSPERCRRLLRERGQAPFRDLADLQKRLQLPPTLVEGWIGRVGFEPPLPGPALPPTTPPTAPRPR
jgi:DNA uptake protein ComE-like DNA-binding protein